MSELGCERSDSYRFFFFVSGSSLTRVSRLSSCSDHAMRGAFRELFEYMNVFLEERWGLGPP